MLEVIVDVPHTDQVGCHEFDHIDALKRAGVPMNGHTLFKGVEVGTLSWENLEGFRRYRWRREESIEEKSKRNFFVELFRRKHRISRQENLAETWYIVEEWNWYWPFWSKWSHVVGIDKIVVTRFGTLYEARRAIQFRENSNRPPVSTIIERL